MPCSFIKLCFFLCSHPLQNRSLFSVCYNRFSVVIEDTLIVQHRNPGPVADVFEWGAIRVFLGSGVIEYLVPVGKVCIRVDLCQTFIGRNNKIIWNDNRVGFCVCKPDRQIFDGDLLWLSKAQPTIEGLSHYPSPLTTPIQNYRHRRNHIFPCLFLIYIISLPLTLPK